MEIGEAVDPASLELRVNGLALPLDPVPEQPGRYVAEVIVK